MVGGEHSGFLVGLYTGEIHTTHALDKVDALHLLVLVKDEGEPALPAMATVPEDSSRVLKASLWASMGIAGAEMVLVGRQRVPDHHHLCGVQPVDVMLPLYTSLWCSMLPSEGACGPRSLSWCAPSWWGAGLTLSRLSRGLVLWGGTTQHRPHGFQLRFCSGLNTLGGNEYPETNSDLSGNVNSTSKL